MIYMMVIICHLRLLLQQLVYTRNFLDSNIVGIIKMIVYQERDYTKILLTQTKNVDMTKMVTRIVIYKIFLSIQLIFECHMMLPNILISRLIKKLT